MVLGDIKGRGNKEKNILHIGTNMLVTARYGGRKEIQEVQRVKQKVAVEDNDHKEAAECEQTWK